MISTTRVYERRRSNFDEQSPLQATTKLRETRILQANSLPHLAVHRTLGCSASGVPVARMRGAALLSTAVHVSCVEGSQARLLADARRHREGDSAESMT